MTDLARPADLPALDPSELLAEFLRGLTPATRDAYAKDVGYFAAFAGCAQASDAARTLLGSGPNKAALLAMRWRDSMTAAGLSSATVRRRLAALRALVTLGQTLGLVEWSLRVKGPKPAGVRDTRGPERREYLNAVRRASVRDAAILRVLGALGVRRGGVVALDLEDFDAARKTLRVPWKGGRTETLTLPPPTLRALLAWIEERGRAPGPLFPGRGGSKRLDGDSIAKLTRRHGLGNPHGLRHSAITRALDVTGGDVRSAGKFARHADAKTTLRYDDERQDVAGRVAALVDEPEEMPDPR